MRSEVRREELAPWWELPPFTDVLWVQFHPDHPDAISGFRLLVSYVMPVARHAIPVARDGCNLHLSGTVLCFENFFFSDTPVFPFPLIWFVVIQLDL